MKTEPEQFILTAVVIGEARPTYKNRAIRDTVSELKGFAEEMKFTVVAITVYDSNGKQVGADIHGDPSTAMRQLMASEFNEPPEVATA
jgi:hypothetical protein